MRITSTTWALLSVASLAGGLVTGCTVTTTNSASDGGGGGPTTTSTSAGTTTTGASTTTTGGSSTTGSTTATGSSTGGTTGGAVTPCSMCADAKCSAEATACKGNSTCAAALDAYYACLSDPTNTPESCLGDFAIQTMAPQDGGPEGSIVANDLGSCLDSPAMDGTVCTDVCKARDGG